LKVDDLESEGEEIQTGCDARRLPNACKLHREVHVQGRRQNGTDVHEHVGLDVVFRCVR
jgi:hypothetical protein